MIPVVKGVDHVIIRTENPARLFYFFTQVLKLPVAWQLSTDRYICTGGVFLGNACLEIISYNQTASGGESKSSLFGIAFEPYDFSQALQELTRRDFPHSCPIPYRGSLKPFRDDFAFNTSPLPSNLGWTMSLLGGLLEGSTPSYYLGKHISTNKFILNLYGRILERFSQLPAGAGYINRVLGFSTFSLIEYPHDTHQLKLQRRVELSISKGGVLGILDLAEIDIGVRNFATKKERWQALLNPLAAVSDGVWRLEDGVSLRLTPHRADRLVSLSLRVADLSQAGKILDKNGWLGAEKKDRLSLSPSIVDGLSIELTA